MFYVAVNEICANKPYHQRRYEAMGGNGKQTLIKTQERLHTIVSN